jgi:hypothetical protein
MNTTHWSQTTFKPDGASCTPTTAEIVEQKQRAVEKYLRWLSDLEVKLAK